MKLCQLTPEQGEFFEAPHDWWWRDYEFSHGIHDVNFLYTEPYFDTIHDVWQDGRIKPFLDFLFDALPDDVDIYTAVDVGCADGSLVRGMIEHGLQYVEGIDASAAAIQFAPSRQRLPPHIFVQHDMRLPIPKRQKFSLATCMELAEHIEPPFASQLVQNLTRLSDLIYFTAAKPGSYGDGKAHINHPNEAPHRLWINLFAFYDYELVKDFDGAEEFRQDGMIFRNTKPKSRYWER